MDAVIYLCQNGLKGCLELLEETEVVLEVVA